MDIEKARAILKRGKPLEQKENNFLRGLKVLSKYDKNITIHFFCGAFCSCYFVSTTEKMTEDEVSLMAKLGWYENTDPHRWAHL